MFVNKIYVYISLYAACQRPKHKDNSLLFNAIRKIPNDADVEKQTENVEKRKVNKFQLNRTIFILHQVIIRLLV